MVKTYNNIIFIIKFLIVEKTFEKIIDYGLRDNSKITNTNLFEKKIAALAKHIFLQNYIC